jgi:hypothetical protein
MDIVDFPTTCRHDRVDLGSVVVDICPVTSQAEWYDSDELVDPASALATLFGQFDLATAAPGLRSPGTMVLAYRPSGRRGRAAMRALPQGRWIEAAPDLWITHDGESLLMSPTDSVLARNLVRDL